MWTVKLINLLLVLGNLCLELTSNRLHSHLRDAHLCRVHLLSYALLWNLPRSGEKYLLRHMLVFCSSNAPFFFCLSQCFWPGVSLPWSGCGAFFFLLLLFFPVSSWKFSWGPWKKYAFFVLSYNIQSVLEKMFPMHCGLNPSSISVSAKHFVLLRWKLYIF